MRAGNRLGVHWNELFGYGSVTALKFIKRHILPPEKNRVSNSTIWLVYPKISKAKVVIIYFMSRNQAESLGRIYA